MDVRQTRIDWIDATKGVGIILVVIGHVLMSGRWYSAIYLFHMPMFFILSGIVYRPEPIGRQFLKRLRSLMIHYACFVLVVIMMRDAVAYLHGTPLDAMTYWDVHQALLGLEGGRFLTNDYGVFWFVTCLFLSLTAYNALRSALSEPLGAPMISIMVGLLLISYPLGRLSLPWDASVVTVAMVFLWIGECWSTIFLARGVRPDSAVLVALSGAIAVLGFWSLAAFDMKMGIYGTPVLSVVAAIALSHLLFIGCMRLVDVRVLGVATVCLGQATLVIMFLHRFFVIRLMDKLPDIAVVVVATAIPFVIWLAIKRSPSLVREALLGERPHPRDHAPAIDTAARGR